MTNDPLTYKAVHLLANYKLLCFQHSVDTCVAVKTRACADDGVGSLLDVECQHFGQKKLAPLQAQPVVQRKSTDHACVTTSHRGRKKCPLSLPLWSTILTSVNLFTVIELFNAHLRTVLGTNCKRAYDAHSHSSNSSRMGLVRQAPDVPHCGQKVYGRWWWRLDWAPCDQCLRRKKKQPRGNTLPRSSLPPCVPRLIFQCEPDHEYSIL